MQLQCRVPNDVLTSTDAEEYAHDCCHPKTSTAKTSDSSTRKGLTIENLDNNELVTIQFRLQDIRKIKLKVTLRELVVTSVSQDARMWTMETRGRS